MTERKSKSGTIDVKALLAEDEEFLRALVRTALEEVLEAEMSEALGAEKGERTAGRRGYRSGYYGRTFITRGGKFGLTLACDHGVLPCYGSVTSTSPAYHDHSRITRLSVCCTQPFLQSFPHTIPTDQINPSNPGSARVHL